MLAKQTGAHGVAEGAAHRLDDRRAAKEPKGVGAQPGQILRVEVVGDVLVRLAERYGHVVGPRTAVLAQGELGEVHGRGPSLATTNEVDHVGEGEVGTHRAQEQLPLSRGERQLTVVELEQATADA